MEMEGYIKFLDKLSFTKNGHGFILNGKGIILAHKNRNLVLKSNFFKDADLDKKSLGIIEKEREGFLSYNLNNTKNYFYFKKFEESGWKKGANMDWIIIYTVPEEDFLFHINKIKYSMFIFMIISMIAAVILALVITGRITNPLGKVLKSVEKIEKGEYDFKLDIARKDEIQIFVNTFNNMIHSLKERDMIRDAFGKYVSKQILEKVTAGEIELGGETKEITVLFSDIRNFTKMSEKIEPHEVVAFLNDYFSKMVETIYKYEGTIDKYMGDGIMAIFGAPIYHADDPKRAILSAMEMRTKLAEINANRDMHGQAPINIGIAIHTGECIVGNIGTKEKIEYTAIGDTVNLTSRLEHLNKRLQTNVIISSSTYEKVKDSFEFKELPTVKVRGREEPVKLYEVLRVLQPLNN